MSGKRPKRPYDIIEEIERLKQCLCCMGLECNKTDLTQFISILDAGDENQVLTTGPNNVLFWNDTKFVKTFLATDFIGGNLIVTETEHGRGADIMVQVLNTTTGYIVPPGGGPTAIINEIKVSSSGKVTITKGAAAPTGFNGKIIII